ERWNESRALPAQDPDAEALHFQISIRNERIREGEPVVHGPAGLIVVNKPAGHLSNGLSPDIEETEIVDAPKIPARVEGCRRSRQRRKVASRVCRRPRRRDQASFRRMKHLR